MKSIAAVLMTFLLSNVAFADNEWKHAAVGVAVGSAGTAIADRYWPENRALVGFAAGVAVGVLGEVVDRGHGWGKWDGRDSARDVVATAIGSAIGALVTDRWILMPVVKRTSQYEYYGLVGQRRF